VFEDEPGPDRLAEIEFLLQQGGQLGLRLRRCDCKPQLGAYAFRESVLPFTSFSVHVRSLLRRAGGLLSARCDQRLDWKTSRGQDHFVLTSCVPWNLVGETARRLQHEDELARNAAASARQAADRATTRGEDGTAHFQSELDALATAARWANLGAELSREVRHPVVLSQFRACAHVLCFSCVSLLMAPTWMVALAQLGEQYLPRHDEGVSIPWRSAGLDA
jgi:hypothetical protein